MKTLRRLALFAALSVLLPAVAAAATTEELRAQFDGIIEGLNENSFEPLNRAIDSKDMTARIFARRLVEPAVKTGFNDTFAASIQHMFTSSFPESKTDILGTVIDFQMEGSEGRAVVRYAASGYRFVYHVYELQVDSRDRLFIVDWLDYYQGGRFTDEAGTALVMALPSKPATRNMMTNMSLNDAQVFQAGELLKAARDNKPDRFYQIYDELDDTLLAERLIVRLNWQMALTSRDGARIEAAAERLAEVFPNDPLQSFRLVEHYILTRQFDRALESLEVLQQGLGVRDGAIESLKVSTAIAMGDNEDAVNYALEATRSEPALELSWWALLRARAAAGDYAGATEAMARLEDDFGKTLDARKLRKDRFLRVLVDKQEFLDWRATRE